MYETEVRVVTMPVSEWMSRYCDPDRFVPACRECPEFGNRWSCPPGAPKAEALVGDLKTVEIIGVKVIYDGETRRKAALSPELADRLCQLNYGRAKRRLLEALLALETLFPDSVTIMAGRCEVCGRCTRPEGKPCRFPEKLRYSYSGLGFNLVGVASEVLNMPLLWQKEGLPEYHVAIASLVHS